MNSIFIVVFLLPKKTCHFQIKKKNCVCLYSLLCKHMNGYV